MYSRCQQTGVPTDWLLVLGVYIRHQTSALVGTTNSEVLSVLLLGLRR
jgi:hypothetical protein